MRALQLTSPGVWQFITLPEPPPPGPGEALVAIRAVGICGTDYSGFRGTMPFFSYPRIIGHELGVEILATGPGVTGLLPGDRCSVEPYLNCAACPPCLAGRSNCCETLAVLGVHTDGGLRERMILPAAKLHRSATLAFDQLALVETLGIGCHAVNRAALTAADTVLVIGAGPIGLTVVEFARLAGARVTVLETNPLRVDFIRRHYPDVALLDDPAPRPLASAVFDATGRADSMARSLSFASFGARVIFAGITPEPVPLDDPLLHRRELTLLATRNSLPADFTRIISLIESGRLDTRPWITHRAPLDAVPDSFPRWLDPASAVVKAVVEL